MNRKSPGEVNLGENWNKRERNTGSHTRVLPGCSYTGRTSMARAINCELHVRTPSHIFNDLAVIPMWQLASIGLKLRRVGSSVVMDHRR